MILAPILLAAIPQAGSGDPRLNQWAEALNQFTGGFVDFAEDLRRPGVAVVYGTIAKAQESKRERLSDKDASLGEGGNVTAVWGTIFFRAEAQGDLAVTEAYCGDAKGKAVPVAYTLQIARLVDGSERVQILTKPKATFALPATGVFVLEREKGKKAWRVTRHERFDAAKESSPDPLTTLRKRAADHYAINRRKADLLDALDAAEKLQQNKELAGAAKRLESTLEAKQKLQLVESDTLATGVVGPVEKRAREALAELQKALPAPAASQPSGGSGEKPPE